MIPIPISTPVRTGERSLSTVLTCCATLFLPPPTPWQWKPGTSILPPDVRC